MVHRRTGKTFSRTTEEVISKIIFRKYWRTTTKAILKPQCVDHIPRVRVGVRGKEDRKVVGAFDERRIWKMG